MTLTLEDLHWLAAEPVESLPPAEHTSAIGVPHAPGLDIVGTTPGELAATIKADVGKWAKVIKEAGITATD